MEYIAQAKDYWIAPQAVKITLNALGNPHRTQATVASGAVIMCYIKGVDGLEYDNGHQYRAWNISASPTYFNTATKKYVYAAIPRSSEVGVQAVIVYPSEILDIYGCNEDGDQVGSEHFYYIWLQGVISESAYNRANRYWLTDIDYGILATDEARDDQSYNTDWYTFNAVTQTVTFLKEIIMKAGSSFRNLILGGHNLTGVATGATPEDIDSDTLVVTPNYIRNKFLHKDRDDTTPYSLTIEQELRVGNRGIMNHLQSTDYTGDGMLDSGYKLWYEEGRAKLVIDDLVARGKFTVNELETRIWTYAGGNMVFSGAGSTIFFVEYLDANENPLGYTYINQPWLLRGRALLAASLSWSKRRQIQRQLTDTERAAVVKFRCYEFSDDGTMQTRNWWHTNDIAMCQSLNKVDGKTNSDGSYSGALSNTVYKRRIAGIGSKEIPMLNDGRVYDYVDLWNIYDVYGQTYINSQGQTVTITDSVKGFQNMAPSGATPSTDWPAAGDVIVQMGNPLDTDRQAAVTIEVQGDVHGFKVYDTISDYSMANKLWVEIGYDQTSGKAKANVYGDFRFGCRENEEAQGGSYIKYNRTTKQLDIRANVRFMSPTSPQQETTLDSFASAVVGDLSNLQSQIDGQIESWFYNYSPVHVDSEGVPDSNVPLNVAPYSDWTTDALKIAHLGDTFTNNESGYCWRFSRNATTNAFEWVIIEDSAVIKALQDAARAQDTADHKRRIFLLPVTISGVTYNYPYPPYDVGDLWVNANYPATGTKTYENEMLRCGTSKAEGQSFDISDWGLANGYTAKLNNFMTNTYAPFVTQISNQVDKKAETFRQANDPSVDWYDDTQVPVYDVRVHHVGDLWMDISADGGKKTYIYENTGSAATPNYEWVEQDVPDEVFDEIDGKAEIFVEKPTDYCERDMWIIESGLADADLPPNCKKGDIVVADNMPAGTTKREGTYVKGDWRKKDRYTDDTKANQVAVGLAQEITDRGQAVAAAQAAAAQDATNKVNAASQQLTEAINAVDNAHSTAEGALEDGYIDNDEREALKAVLKSLDAEFSDVTASYSVVYNNELLNGTTQKTALNTAYTALVSAHDAYDAAFTSFIDAPDTTKYEKGDSEGDYTYTPEGAQEEVTVNLTTLQTTFNTCAATYQTALENANAKIQDKIKEIADAATAEITSYRYIKNALGATTVTQGGLMLTSAIFLRQLKQDGDPTKDSDYTTWSGINGTTPDGDRSIAAWYGGDMVDYEGLTPEQKAAGWGTGTGQQRYAKTLFRMDGTGYMAGGKIHWDSNGDGFVANGNVAWTTINGVTSVTINGATVQNAPSVNTQQLLINGTDVTAKLNALFDMFEKDTTTISGTTLIKAKYSLYSVGDISAMGQSSGGGGGGGGGGASVLYELNDVKRDGNNVYGAAEGKVLTYGSDNKWYASDLFLPKSGGTMTGNITMGANAIVFNESHTSNWNVGSNSGIKILNTVGQSGTGAPNDYAIGLSVSGYYRFQLAAYGGGGSLKFRNGTRGEYEDWVTLIDSSTIGSQSVSYAESAGSVAWSNVSSKPTTLSGYGITDSVYCTQVAEAQDNVTWAKGVADNNRKAFIYNSLGNEYSYLFGFSSSNTSSGHVSYGAVLKMGYADKYLRLLRVYQGTWKSEDWEKISAGYADTAGGATNDSDGNAINSTYLKLSGGTVTGATSFNANVLLNSSIKVLAAPTYSELKSSYGLRNDYESAGYPTEDYLKAWCRFAYANAAGYTVVSVAQPSSRGYIFADFYSSGVDGTTGLPRYCTGRFYNYGGASLIFGTNNYTWYYRYGIDSSNIGSQSVNYATSAGKATNDSDGNAINTTYAKLGAHNNLTASGNEFTFASSGLSGSVYFNYRTAGGTNGNITEYVFGNGKGGSLGTALHTGNYSSYALAKSGGTMTGVLTLQGSQYDGYKTGSARTYGLNANNSDIVGVNSIIMSDKSDSWAESFGFPRDDSGNAGHYDTFRAANGTFYFGFNGYFDSSNVEHAASELVTITGTTIKLERADSSTASVRMKNTSRDISLDAGSTNCGVYYQTGSKWLIGTNGTDTWLSTGKVGIGTTSPSQLLHVSGGLIAITNNSRTLTIGAQNSSAIHIYNDNNSGTYFNGVVSSNGNGAYDLGTSTYPWKKLYAQGCEIYATSPSVHVGTSSSARISLHWSSDDNRGLYDYTGYWVIGANTNTFLMRGNVGIGTTSPSYKLHVSGDIYATGDVTAASDERQKCDIEQVDLSVEQIANAPAVKFSWKDGRDNLRHVGTFAQYWQKALPESVTEKNDILGMNYGSAALVSVVKVAKKVLTHEEEIEQLKKRVRELEHEVEQLKSA